MEARVEVNTYELDYKCPECDIGVLICIGRILMTKPIRYHHECNNCNHKCDLSTYSILIKEKGIKTNNMEKEVTSIFSSDGKEYKMKSNLYMFNTSYEVDGKPHVSRVFAKSWEEAVEHIKQKK